MRIDVVNILRTNTGGCAGLLHDRERGISLWMRLGKVVLVNGGAIADEFAQDGRATAGRVWKAFQGEHRCAFSQGQAIALGIERAADGG